MLSSAHTYILSAYGSKNPRCCGDLATERYLIAHGYAVYVAGKKPLMILTKHGRNYAERNGKWLRSGRV